MKALTAAALTIPPIATLLFLAGQIGLEAYITLNITAPPAAAALQALQRLRQAKRSLGQAQTVACTVCTHPERRALEERLAAGEQVDRVAEEYGLDEDVLASHHALHMSGQAGGPSGRVDVEEELSKILAELKAMQERLKRLDALFEAGEVRVQDYIRLLAERRALTREIRGLLLLMARTGQKGGGERDIGALLRRLRGP
ncbi:MAG: hypothetical protein RMJ28_06925 [Nitrososphaerota archaeon]|nr:hypothetical protein [Candidatus Calditenuaceae archaeon]MDW8073946.1 hypothetical protein [Nitrososphaerota archaeon]